MLHHFLTAWRECSLNTAIVSHAGTHHGKKTSPRQWRKSLRRWEKKWKKVKGCGIWAIVRNGCPLCLTILRKNILNVLILPGQPTAQTPVPNIHNILQTWPLQTKLPITHTHCFAHFESPDFWLCTPDTYYTYTHMHTLKRDFQSPKLCEEYAQLPV